jgi:predicted metal-dependent hydrolase
MRERLVYLQQKNEQQYTRAVLTALKENQELMQRVTESAITFLDIDPETFGLTLQSIMKNPEAQKMFQKIELDIRDKHEPKTLITKTKDEMRKIYVDKLQMEAMAQAEIQQAAA